MHRTPAVLLATAALAAAGAPVATAAPTAAQPFTVRGTMHVVSAQDVAANGDGRYVVSGPVTSARLGRGSAVYRNTVRDGHVTGTVVATFAQGTIHTSMRGTFVLSTGRTTGTGRITRATGAYRGATGTFTFTGQTGTDLTTQMTIEGRVRPR